MKNFPPVSRTALPRGFHYALAKDPVTEAEQKTLPGWAVIDQENGFILGHGMKTQMEARIFAQGCRAGISQLGRSM